MLHQIGVGALGPVFRTYEPTRDRLVAVKVFRLDLTPEQATALADELGRVADASLFHPSIVEPLSAGLEGTVAYRAEEYVAAESLDVAMRHYAPATLEKVLPFITQLASAIDFARLAGVGHGALHPRDIFVTPDEARATGFGVVDALDRLGLRAPVRRPYSPPERIAGERWGTPADVFSLGAIAFELITGRRPSGIGDQIGALTGANLGDRAEAIRVTLVRAMREHPIERYATAMEFASELDRAAGRLMPTLPAVRASAVEDPAPTPSTELRAGKVEAPRVSPVEAPVPSAGEAPALSEVEGPAPSETAEEVATDAAAAQEDTRTFGLTLDDSPREVARKVIAARESRKRQGQSKSKIHGRQDPDAAVSLLVPPDPIPEPAADTTENTVATSQFVPESSGPDLSALELPDDLAVLNLPLAADKDDKDPDDTVAARVAAVDEFRPRAREREIDAFRAERTWPRAADRQNPLADLPMTELPSARSFDDAPGRPEPVEGRLSDLASPRSSEPPALRASEAPSLGAPELPIERAVMPKPTALEPFDPELPPPLPLRPTAEPPPPEPARPPAEDHTTVERPRTMLLPTAVGLIVGLLIGFLTGHSVGSRDAAKADVQPTQPAPSTAQAPASGKVEGAAQSRVDGPAAIKVQEPAAANAQQSTPPSRVPPATGAQPPGTPAPSEQRRADVPPVPSESTRAAAAASHATSPKGAEPPPSTAKPPAPSSPQVKPPVPSEQRRVEGPAAAAPGASREPPKADAAVTAGRIVVSSAPSRAAVIVNGVWSGRTPLTLSDRPFGKYIVRIVEPGYAVARQEFVLSSSAPAKTIAVTLEPSGAARGEKPAGTGGDGPPPSERKRAQDSVLVPPLPVESTPAPTSTRGQAPVGPSKSIGSIYVDSRPRGARVLVDGRDYGVTPTTVPGLTVGQHAVRLELADHAPWTANVSVTVGTAVRVTGSLEPIR